MYGRNSSLGYTEAALLKDATPLTPLAAFISGTLLSKHNRKIVTTQ